MKRSSNGQRSGLGKIELENGLYAGTLTDGVIPSAGAHQPERGISCTTNPKRWSAVGYNEALHSLVEWIQPETGEPRRCHGPQLFRVQFYQDSPYTSHAPSYGGGCIGRLWNVEDLVALWEAYEQRRAERAA